VPRLGVWDEQNAAMVAQGFTVQFKKVKRHLEEASRTAPAPLPGQPPKLLSPDHAAAAPRAQRHGKRKAERSFVSRMYRCLFPRDDGNYNHSAVYMFFDRDCIVLLQNLFVLCSL
jgi:hypothetical protein